LKRNVELSFILGLVGGIIAIIVTLVYAYVAVELSLPMLIAGIVGICGSVLGKKLGGVLMIVAGVLALIGGGFVGVPAFIPLLIGGIIVLRKKVVEPTLLATAGVLTIIASCMSLFLGIFGVVSGYVYFEYVGIFGILSFAFGLAAGISALKKKMFILSILGISLLIVSGILFSSPIDGNSVWEIGLAITILSILSIVFVAKAREKEKVVASAPVETEKMAINKK